MPRLKPTPDEQRERNFDSVVRAAALRLGLRNDTDTARFLGLKQQTFCGRMLRKSGWNYPELVRMVKRLKITDEELKSIF